MLFLYFCDYVKYLKYLPFLCNETKCVAAIKLRCQPSWKWNILDN